MFEGIELFGLLHDEDRQDLAGVVDTQRVAAGNILFRAGEPGESLFVVHSGSIELFIKDTAGQRIVLTVAEAGGVFGELSLLDAGPRTATAVAVTDAELLVLDRDDLLLLFQRRPDAALHMLAAMSGMTRKADALLRTRVSRNANEEMEEHLTPLQRVADWIAWFSGSMPFLFLNGLWFIFWIAINTIPLGLPAFDPYPFGFLTMIVSLEAIFLSTFVMISQNRQAARGDIRNQIDFENNIRSEIWSVHVGHALGLDVDHVEQVVQLAIEGAARALKEAQSATP
jgi:uncharacterized membrane protein